MSEYNPYKKDESTEPEFMVTKTKPASEEADAANSAVAMRTTDKIVSIVYASLLLALQILTLIFVLCGCVRFNDSGINIVSAFDLIINVFTMTLGTVYKSLIGGALAVAFFVCVVFMIIRIARSIRFYVVIIKGRNTAASDCRINKYVLGMLYDKYISSFVNMIIFTVVSNLLGMSELSGMTITLTVFAGIMFVAQGVINCVYIDKDSGVIDLILNTVKNTALYIALALTVVFLNNTAGKDFIYGAQKMFNGNVFGGGVGSTMYSLYVNIFEPLLFVAIAIDMLIIITGELRCTFTLEKERRSKITAALALLAITMVMHLIFRVFVASGATSFRISLIGYWLKLISSSYLPLLLFAVVMLMLSLVGKKSPDKSKTEKAVPPATTGFSQQV